MSATLSVKAKMKDIMPAMLKHEGLWRGTYRHIDINGVEEDVHKAEVRCVFPDTGPYSYIQYNHFTWADGRVHKAELPGILRDNKLWWDTETFHGCSWESDGLILLNLARKDEPGANFFEIIALGDTGTHRARTWHWFKDGQLYRRTLCDEVKVE